MPNDKESVGYDEDTDYDILDFSSPSVCTLASAKGAVEHTYNCIVDGYAQRLALYAKVSKEPKAASEAIVCEHEYELVDVSHCLGLTKTINVDDIASESATTRTKLNLGALSLRNGFLHGTKEHYECETNKIVINVRSVESVKVYEDGEAIAMNGEESTEQQLSFGDDNNEYDNIDL